MSTRRNCKATKKNGNRCGADVQIGKAFCVFHDPEKANDGARARRAGGIQRSRRAAVLPPTTPDSPLASSSDLAFLLADSINRVRRGELDPRIANAIGYLASVQLRCFEQSTLEDRMTKIETTMGLMPRPMFHLREELPKQTGEKPQESA